MESMIAFLVGFPFVSALFLAIFKNNTARKITTYLSSAAIIAVSLIFAVSYFIGDKTVITVNEGGLLFGLPITHLFDYLIIGVEVFLVALVTFLSFKHKKYPVALLSIAQTALTFWYEFSGREPENGINNIRIDQLTVVMVLIIAIVGTLITVYANGYMNDYHHHHTDVKDRRPFFFAIMYIFLGSMFGLVLSNSLLWLYFFWEITSVCSFLLIGYTKNAEAVTNSFRALWMNLLGGCGLAGGIVFAGIRLGVTDITGLLAFAEKDEAVKTLIPVALLAFAALTKSAQLPFSKWLLGAMVAPTPSSALLHSATMVKAGVYLLIRLAPLMAGQTTGYMVSLIGGLTFLVMSMLAITVSDGKKVLAYSTLSNLGLITACAGVGTAATVWAATFLMIFHAVSKSLLFQTVGSIEHQTGSRDIESMHGLIRRYPQLTMMLVIGIAGMFLAPFGMLVSKWAALKAFIDSGTFSITLVLLICFGSATTLFYWAKWLATVLASNPNDNRLPRTISKNQWFSLSVHSFLMIALCFIFPSISRNVLIPYVSAIFGPNFSVLPQDDIILTIIMILFVFIIPFISYFLIARNRPFAKADRYFSGIGLPDQVGFIDSFGNEKKEFLTNWYMTSLFGEDKMYLPSVLVAIGIIATFGTLSLVMGGAF